MIFSLEVRRARKGDCLLLHFGTPAEPGLIVIDGGPSAVYKPHLRPRLIQLRAARDNGDEPLSIDLVMVSHVDDDHIQGILDMTKELVEAPLPFARVTELWHNTFDTLIGNDPAELTAGVHAFGVASVAAGSMPEELAESFQEVSEREIAITGAKVLASIAQGHQLRLDADKLNIGCNVGFEAELVMAASEPVALAGSDVLTMHVVGPRKDELNALQKKHDDWLKALKKAGKKPPQALAAYLDESVQNLSSIVGLVECKGKTILLTGDARGDNILAGLEAHGLLNPGETLNVDVLKVPHHGSANNLDDDFFERIIADHYVFSGNGEHGNPERESIEMLLNARAEEPFTIHLTYPLKEIDSARAKDWNEQRAKEVTREKAKKEHNKQPGAKKKKLVPPRVPWDAQEHGLATLLQQRPLGAAQTLEIVSATDAHVIDLLDPLPF